MAASIQKKKTTSIKAVLDINEDGNIFLLVEDVEDAINLKDVIADYNKEEVKITICQSNDLV